MALGAVEVFVVGFQEPVVDAKRLAARRGIGAEHHPVLILDEELARAVRLPA
jgi:hypothetical protein